MCGSFNITQIQGFRISILFRCNTCIVILQRVYSAFCQLLLRKNSYYVMLNVLNRKEWQHASSFLQIRRLFEIAKIRMLFCRNERIAPLFGKHLSFADTEP